MDPGVLSWSLGLKPGRVWGRFECSFGENLNPLTCGGVLGSKRVEQALSEEEGATSDGWLPWQTCPQVAKGLPCILFQKLCPLSCFVQACHPL